jgi:hypothetical protein
VSQARLWIEEVSDRHVGKPSEHYAIFRERNERIRPGGIAERPRAGLRIGATFSRPLQSFGPCWELVQAPGRRRER